MRLCEVLYCAALPFDHTPEMNGQSMWSDGCGVKAGLQICNIRFKASLTAIHSASAGEPFNIPLAARGAASGDLDNDGDTDFVIKTLNGAPGRSAQQRNEESLDRIKPAGKKVEPPGSRRSRVGR
jgi:hypothetical protein